MILDEIVSYKKTIINDLKKQFSYKDLEKKATEQILAANSQLSFYQALKSPGLSLIAEVKKGSPSKGIIRQDFNPTKIATEFQKQKASAISVLTDEKFFFGSNQYLSEIRNIVSIPIIRKDFILDEIQILESKAIGANAILLIASILDELKIESFFQLAHEFDMDVLCEVHNKQELETVLNTNCDIIGINNRDLSTFSIDLNTTYSLKNLIPSDRLVVCESGITNIAELKNLQSHNIDAVLIGEGLATNPGLFSYWNKETS